MKTSIFILLFLALTISTATASQRYNPFTNKWETASSKAVITYNPYENTWEYAEPESTWEYNIYVKKWEPAKLVPKKKPYHAAK